MAWDEQNSRAWCNGSIHSENGKTVNRHVMIFVIVIEFLSNRSIGLQQDKPLSAFLFPYIHSSETLRKGQCSGSPSWLTLTLAPPVDDQGEALHCPLICRLRTTQVLLSMVHHRYFCTKKFKGPKFPLFLIFLIPPVKMLLLRRRTKLSDRFLFASKQIKFFDNRDLATMLLYMVHNFGYSRSGFTEPPVPNRQLKTSLSPK